jgi:DNA-binding IclR family transcriptional regulator
MTNWTLFSNHGHVLVCLARDSQARLRDVAADVGITERAVQKIVRDLQDGGMVSVTKNGRRNQYRIHNRKSLRHDLEAHCTLGDLTNIIKKEPGSARIASPVVQKPRIPGIQVLAPSEKPVSRKSKSLQTPVETRPTPVSAPPQVESKINTAEPEKSGPAKVKRRKPKVSDTVERRQRSLF